MGNPYHDPANGQFADGPGGEGMAHENGHAKTGDRTTDAVVKNPAMAPMTKGLKGVASRMVDAENKFKDSLMSMGDINREQASAAVKAYRDAKVLKTDAVGGYMTVKHGGFLDRSVIRRAAGIKE